MQLYLESLHDHGIFFLSITFKNTGINTIHNNYTVKACMLYACMLADSYKNKIFFSESKLHVYIIKDCIKFL